MEVLDTLKNRIYCELSFLFRKICWNKRLVTNHNKLETLIKKTRKVINKLNKSIKCRKEKH